MSSATASSRVALVLALPLLSIPLLSIPLLSIPLLSISPVALAGSPTLAAPEHEPKIFGGVPTEPCQWPMVVSMQGNCSATLVHPEIVVYAAHCGEGYSSIWFGEDIDAPTGVMPTEYCVTNPAFTNLGQNSDFAFCKLAEPVEAITPVPILMGCETALLQPGAEVVAVGFGFDEFDGYGVKRHVSFPIVTVEPSGEVEAGGDGFSICNGDSGGPLFMRLPESMDPQRAWRVFGVTSYGPFDCNEPQFFGTMHAAVPWIEATSGIDITPCHNADGSWQPGPECTGFPTSPDLAQGDWSKGCGPVEVGGKAESCGEPALDEDLLPPTALVLTPIDGSVFTSDMGTGKANVEILAEVEDQGWGLVEVVLLLDGQPLANSEKTQPPWVWTGAFPKGGYLVSVRATDLAGNVT
ncbi:MAG: trypsin-like serine protease, partial [Deltaproteobacteria bacterium]|nr:trypsin-like serine protease [Deltaproteobacteria bacterium]